MAHVSRDELLKVMHNTGHFDMIERARQILPDPVDLQRDRKLLESLGLSKGGLMEDMGGSP